MTDTIVFDLDGTLLNTLEDITDSVDFALGEMGFPLRTAGEVRMMVGNSVDHLIHSALPEGHTEREFLECREIYNRHYSGNMRNKTAPYPGVYEMLEAVRKAGYKTAVVSNKDDEFTAGLVKELFGDYIMVAVGKSPERPRKPAPDGVWHALKLLGSAKENAVYVGDSEVDALTAKNSGLPCVGCLWGFRDRETLEKNGADIIIKEPLELLEAVRTIDAGLSGGKER